MTDTERFDAHLDCCEICMSDEDRYVFCPIGKELLLDAGQDLPEEWHFIARRIREDERLEKDAQANFEYYAEAGEF